MQTLSEIRQLLRSAGLNPQRKFGQNFLHDLNLMQKLVETAALTGDETVLEVGPGTGSLTEELLERAGRVVAVEIDRGFQKLLRQRLDGRENFALLSQDVLARKHALAPEVIAELRPAAVLVSNLPYNIATPLVAQCLLDSWHAAIGRRDDLARFDRLTFTVQQEVADRLAAGPGTGDYGPVSVLVSLLGRVQPGPAVPPTAFWPRPQVHSRILRIDFDADAARRIADVETLSTIVSITFNQRRKQVKAVAKRKGAPFDPERFEAALAEADIDGSLRPEQVPPEKFARLANALTPGR